MACVAALPILANLYPLLRDAPRQLRSRRPRNGPADAGDAEIPPSRSRILDLLAFCVAQTFHAIGYRQDQRFFTPLEAQLIPSCSSDCGEPFGSKDSGTPISVIYSRERALRHLAVPFEHSGIVESGLPSGLRTCRLHCQKRFYCCRSS